MSSVKAQPSAKTVSRRARAVLFAEESICPPSSLKSKEERLRHKMQVHRTLVDTARENQELTVVPFAKACQERLEALGGWKCNGINFEDQKLQREMGPPRVERQFVLPNSRSNFPVTVVDRVIPDDWCRSFIDVHERVGFERPTSVLLALADKHEDENLRKYAYDVSKNTSQLVQIESTELAQYLWDRLGKFLPETQRYEGTQNAAGIYAKCGIIPVFRFMRYQQSQGFKPHTDPQRIYCEYPLQTKDLDGKTTKHGDPGIYLSLFTIAFYLNDPSEFEGGTLDFVKLRVDGGKKSHESQATVVPAMGRCVIFSHDELHEGGGVESGTKYMCQLDVLYERVDDLPSTLSPP